jgi:Holliday junction resolvase RusA-like endonuclease
MIELEFDWFNPILNPNTKTVKCKRTGKYKAIHWSAKSKAQQQQKNDAYYIAISHPKPEASEKYVLNITFRPKTNQRQDVDNCISSIKGLLDGVAKAWGVDDSQFVLMPVMGSKIKDGKIIIKTKELNGGYND